MAVFQDKDEESVLSARELNRKLAVDTYNRGGVVTAAWHFSNPVSGGGFYWRDSVSLHYYAPFPGHSSVPDFMKFYNAPYTLFEKDLKNIYR